MTIEFRKAIKEAYYLDPARNFSKTRIDLEVRIDPLTHSEGRVMGLGSPTTDPSDLGNVEKRLSEAGCPYCMEVARIKATEIPKNGAQEPIQRGSAIVIPEIIPFDVHGAVCLFSEDHSIPFNTLSPQILSDAFLASQQFLGGLAAGHPDLRYFSINWSHTPSKGDRLVHPHLFAIAGEEPTNLQRDLLQASREYITHNLNHYWRDLVEMEKSLGERFLGKMGRVAWVVPFVPSGLCPDAMAVFCERTDLLEMDEQDFGDFSRGLTNLLKSYFALGIDSFNLSLLSGVKGDPSLWVHSRITPYYPRHAIRSNDATCFEMLHNEPISLMKPEEMAARLRPYFSQEPTRDAPAIRFMVTPQ